MDKDKCGQPAYPTDVWLSLTCFRDPLVAAALTLSLLGIFLTASAVVSGGDVVSTGQPPGPITRQAVSIAVGLLLGIAVLRLPLSRLRAAGLPLLLVAYGLCSAVLIPGIGKMVNGAQRWLDFGGFQLEVSKPVTLLMSIFLAAFLARNPGHPRIWSKEYVLVLSAVGLTVLLLLLEPHSPATLLAIMLVMLYLVGMQPWQLALTTALMGVFWLAVLSVLPWGRFGVWSVIGCFSLWDDLYNFGFSLTNCHLVLPVVWDQWIGAGFGAGGWVALLTEWARTDFMFSLLAHDLGLLGVCSGMILYGILLWRAFDIARRALHHDYLFAALLGRAFGVWIAFQAVFHIAANFGFGQSHWILPLVGYGGSSMVVTWVFIALLLRTELEMRLLSITRVG